MSRAVDTVLAYRLLKMLATPINKSDAYNLGVIDANGKKIKEPTTSQEKDSYTILNRFIFKVQKALTKSPDMSSRRLLTFAAALSLLREYKDDDDDLTVQTMLELYMEDETVKQNAILLESNVVSFKDYFTEEIAANAVGGGNIHGMGVGAKGEPGVNTLAKWPFPGMSMPSLFRRKPVIKRKKKGANSK